MRPTDALARLVPALGRSARGGFLRRRGGAPLIWAHRGVSAHATENTEAAFALAVEHGADGVEFDVMVCATGEPVVFHDDDLVRMAGRADPLEALDFAAVRAVRLAGGHRIPTLAEALDACGELFINVELKVPHPGRPGPLPGAVTAVLLAAPQRGRVVVSSFDPVALWQFHLAAPDLPLGFLFETAIPAPWRTIGALLGASSLHVQHDLCTPAAVAAWKQRGFGVHAWTVDDPDRLRALAAAGIDGVFANDPRAARASLVTA